MIQFRSFLVRHLQTACAVLVVITALNVSGAIASDQELSAIRSVTSSTDQAGLGIVIQNVSFASTEPAKTAGIPVLILAGPGRAFVFSNPNQQIQVVIEGQSGLCKAALVQTDNAGAYEMPIASTRNCPSPRLVVAY